MPGTIDVDTTNETATVSFVDDKGNETTAPAGAVVTFASDDEAVATIAANPDDQLVGTITPVAPGSANISVLVTGALEADGITPIASPDPVTLTVNPGAATGERLTLGPQ